LAGRGAAAATSLKDIDREKGGFCRKEEAEILVGGAEIVTALLEPGRCPLRGQMDVLRYGPDG
jgi:hypothetical protein